MIFLCAQPDEPYFHWQVELLIHNFVDVGIRPDSMHVLFCCAGKPSSAAQALARAYPLVRFFFYGSTLEKTGGYMPLVRPHILAKHFAALGHLKNETIFYHDCDILFRALPNFTRLVADDVCYLSEASTYIGADHIQSKGDDLLAKMAQLVDIDPQVVIRNQANSGGAQYLLKGVDVAYWQKVEKDTRRLYTYFRLREATERLFLNDAELATYRPIQKWCADMWGVLWNLWYFGKATQITPELSFAWSVDSSAAFYQHNILHNAGVEESMRATHFFKSDFLERDPFDCDLGYVQDSNCSWHYVQAIYAARPARERARAAPAGA